MLREDVPPYQSVYAEHSSQIRLFELMADEQKQFDLTVPGYSYMGPGTKFISNLYNKKKPVNSTDAIAFEHDYQYTINPTYNNKVYSDLVAIRKGFTTKIDNAGDLASRAALIGGLAAKTLTAYSPFSLGYNFLFGDTKPNTEDSKIINELYGNNKHFAIS